MCLIKAIILKSTQEMQAVVPPAAQISLLTKIFLFITLNLSAIKSMKKSSAHSKKPTHKAVKRQYNKGALGAGTAYALLGMLVIMAAGSLMIGNIIPSGDSPKTGQSVILLSTTPEAEKSNLQLYYFPGATYTPTPSPTTPPQPQNEGGNNWGGGSGSGGGGGDGGSSSPGGGGGSGGGGGGGGSAVGAR